MSFTPIQGWDRAHEPEPVATFRIFRLGPGWSKDLQQSPGHVEVGAASLLSSAGCSSPWLGLGPLQLTSGGVSASKRTSAASRVMPPLETAT